MAPSKPPKALPWYRVLVDERDLRTYVAERNLEPDEAGDPVIHPEVGLHFANLIDKRLRHAERRELDYSFRIQNIGKGLQLFFVGFPTAD